MKTKKWQTQWSNTIVVDLLEIWKESDAKNEEVATNFCYKNRRFQLRTSPPEFGLLACLPSPTGRRDTHACRTARCSPPRPAAARRWCTPLGAPNVLTTNSLIIPCMYYYVGIPINMYPKFCLPADTYMIKLTAMAPCRLGTRPRHPPTRP